VSAGDLGQVDPPRAQLIGTGLIGASVGLALRARGWHFTGTDVADGRAARAVELGACYDEGVDAAADLVVVATPVGEIVEQVHVALRACPQAVVTDVGGVKGPIVGAIDDPRFVGGHPMAGSEQLGVEGASASLFDGNAWVLCPGEHTSDRAYATVRELVASTGAEVLTLDAMRHDELVAVVSHVPHLTAAALVTVARDRSEEHRALLRLAAGGFRDMTRIAAGSPAIWPDVCAQNREAILDTMDRLLVELGHLRQVVAGADRGALLGALGEAQRVRRNLPTRPTRDVAQAELRVPIPDRPGALAAVAVLATDLGVNLRSVETIDASETSGGVVVLQVALADVERLQTGLLDAGFRAVVASPPEGTS
jgi:prephenate dehydrogenase